MDNIRTAASAASLVALLALSGCSTLDALTFQKSEHSGVSNQQVNLIFDLKQPIFSSDEKLEKLIYADGQLYAAIQATCGRQLSASIAPVFAPLFVSLGKLLFDLAAAGRMNNLEGIKKAAQVSYSGTLVADINGLINSPCVLILRHGIDDTVPGFVALLKFKDESGRAFVIEPIYVRARNAVAVTSQDNRGLALAIAVSIKSVIKRPSGTSLIPTGQGVVSIPKITIGPDGSSYQCTTRCPRSDLIPYPADRPVSLTVAVTETGVVGFDVDLAMSETKAVKEAIGPALAEVLKESLKEN